MIGGTPAPAHDQDVHQRRCDGMACETERGECIPLDAVEAEAFCALVDR